MFFIYISCNFLQGEDSIEDFMDHVEGYEKGRVSPKVRKLVKPKCAKRVDQLLLFPGDGHQPNSKGL